MGLDCKQPVRAGGGCKWPVQDPHGATYDACVGFLRFPVVSIPLRVHKGVVKHPCGYRKGTIRVPYDMKNIGDSRAGPAPRPKGQHTGSMWSPANYLIKP